MASTALALAAAACSSSSDGAAQTASSPPTTAELAQIHSVPGMGHLAGTRLNLIGRVAIVTGSGVSWIKFYSDNGATLPGIGWRQLANDVAVAQVYADSGETFRVTWSQDYKDLGLVQFQYMLAHEGGTHYVVISRDNRLFDELHGSSHYGRGDLAYDAQTMQMPKQGLTFSLLRSMPDTEGTRGLMADLTATELCNSIVRANVAPGTLAVFGKDYADAIRREGQETLCNSIGFAAEAATADRLDYVGYQTKYVVAKDPKGGYTAQVLPALAGRPIVLRIGPEVYNMFQRSAGGTPSAAGTAGSLRAEGALALLWG